jgi:hypothetical protein
MLLVLSLEEMLQNWNYDLNLQPESEATIFSKDSFSNNKPYYHVTLVPQIHCKENPGDTIESAFFNM